MFDLQNLQAHGFKLDASQADASSILSQTHHMNAAQPHGSRD